MFGGMETGTELAKCSNADQAEPAKFFRNTCTVGSVRLVNVIIPSATRHSGAMQSLDDDFSFNSSVWGVPTPAPSLLSPPPPLSSTSPAVSHDQLDDFDDFHTPLESKTPSLAQDDDFADFGDFGEVGGSDANFAFEEDTTFSEKIQVPDLSQLSWRSLRIDPVPSAQDLSVQIEEILGPVWPYKLSSLTSDEDIRQVEGISQVLTTSSRCAACSFTRSFRLCLVAATYTHRY